MVQQITYPAPWPVGAPLAHHSPLPGPRPCPRSQLGDVRGGGVRQKELELVQEVRMILEQQGHLLTHSSHCPTVTSHSVSL